MEKSTFGFVKGLTLFCSLHSLNHHLLVSQDFMLGCVMCQRIPNKELAGIAADRRLQTCFCADAWDFVLQQVQRALSIALKPGIRESSWMNVGVQLSARSLKDSRLADGEPYHWSGPRTAVKPMGVGSHLNRASASSRYHQLPLPSRLLVRGRGMALKASPTELVEEPKI